MLHCNFRVKVSFQWTLQSLLMLQALPRLRVHLLKLEEHQPFPGMAGNVIFSPRKQMIFHDATNGFPAKCLRNKHRNSILIGGTSQIREVFLIGRAACEICFNQSEALPRSGWWSVISMEFLCSFLRRHFAGKLRWHHKMSSTFLGNGIFSYVRLFSFLHVLSAFSEVKSKIFNSLYLLASAFQLSSIGRDLKGSRGVNDIHTNSHESICVSFRSKHTRGRCTDNYFSMNTSMQHSRLQLFGHHGN